MIYINVKGKSMIDACRDHNHVAGRNLNSDPLLSSAVICTTLRSQFIHGNFFNLLANVKVSLTLHDESNFFVGMQMLSIEVLQFIFIVRQALARAGDLLMMTKERMLMQFRINWNKFYRFFTSSS